MMELCLFTDEFKNNQIDLIKDLLARNLIAQMLTKDPARRPLMSQVLAHPFFTGRHSARLVGMAPEFDVFISYRVASDAHHAEQLFNMLRAREIKVWCVREDSRSVCFVVCCHSIDWWLC
jgi:serine/threonine protein kinase